MERSPRRIGETVLEAARVSRDRNIDFMASAVTYYELLSLAPLTVLAFIGLAALGGETFAATLLSRATGVLPAVGRQVVGDIMAATTASTGLAGLLIILWASLRVFRGFDVAFAEVHGADHDETVLKEVVDALVALVVFGVAVVVVVAAGGAVVALSHIPSIDVLWTAATFIGLSAVFLPLYYVFTDVDIGLSGLVPGALVAAAGWTLLQGTFRLYTAYAASSFYGVFGGVLLLVFWMYVGNILILYGAAVNYVHWEG